MVILKCIQNILIKQLYQLNQEDEGVNVYINNKYFKQLK